MLGPPEPSYGEQEGRFTLDYGVSVSYVHFYSSLHQEDLFPLSAGAT